MIVKENNNYIGSREGAPSKKYSDEMILIYISTLCKIKLINMIRIPKTHLRKIAAVVEQTVFVIYLI